jgi:hypothetical protein
VTGSSLIASRVKEIVRGLRDESAIDSALATKGAEHFRGLPMAEVDLLIRRSWPVFREALRTGRTITYTELAERVGRPLNRRHLHRQLLTPLSLRCRAAQLPDLSALVVRKDTGRPGGGWGNADANSSGGRKMAAPDSAWIDALRDCLAFAWPDQVPPVLLCEPDTDLSDRSASRVNRRGHRPPGRTSRSRRL